METEKLYTLQEARDFLFSNKTQVKGNHRNVWVECVNEDHDQAVADAILIFLNALDDSVRRDAMKIKLTDLHGINRLSGTDEQGNHWREFHVDYLAEQSDGVCSKCGKGLSSGWMCLDGGEEICGEHVEF